MASQQGRRNAFPKECNRLKNIDGGKPVALTYEGDVDLEKVGAQNIQPETASLYYAQELAPALGNVCVYAEGKKSGTIPVISNETQKLGLLDMRAPGAVTLRVNAGSGGSDQCGPKVWSSEVPVAQFGTAYQLPIPAPKIFSKQVFAMTVSEAGALTSIQYSSTTGAGPVMNTLNSLASAVKSPSTADKAAEIKAQGDLIAAQQRLVKCVADPTTCQ